MDSVPPPPHRTDSGFIRLDMSTPGAIGSHPTPQAGDSDHANLGNTFLDPQDKFWSLYLADAEKYDKVRIESWQGDTDCILIFVRLLCLFCAVTPVFMMIVIDWSILCYCGDIPRRQLQHALAGPKRANRRSPYHSDCSEYER